MTVVNPGNDNTPKITLPANTYKDWRSVEANKDRATAEKIYKEKRIKQIIVAVVSAVAFAVFAALAVLSFVGFALALSGAALLAMPTFVPLAIGVIASVAAIGLAALAVKSSLDAHRNIVTITQETAKEALDSAEILVKKAEDLLPQAVEKTKHLPEDERTIKDPKDKANVKARKAAQGYSKDARDKLTDAYSSQDEAIAAMGRDVENRPREASKARKDAAIALQKVITLTKVAEEKAKAAELEANKVLG